MGFFRQEYWSGLPGEDIPDPEIKPESPMSPVLKADSLLLEPSRNNSDIYQAKNKAETRRQCSFRKERNGEISSEIF